MPKLTVEGFAPVDVESGKRLVLAIEQDAGVDILHACGGNARCTTCRIEFVSGEPVRMTQAEQATSASAKSANKKTNPTTRSEGGLGVHVVRDGDTLQSIAHKTYGDPGRWRTVAEANGIDNPLHLRRGTPLNLPRLD